MSLRSWMRSLFAAKKCTIRKAPAARLDLSRGRLEDRLAPAGFAEAGANLNLNLNTANEQVAIVSNGTSYTLTLTGGTWSGTNSANVTGNGTNNLSVTTAGLAAFNNVNITDSAAGTGVAFNDSGANAYSDNFTVTLDDAAAGAINFSGASSFTGANALSASTSFRILVNAAATVSTVDGGITFNANQQAIPTAGDFQGVRVVGTVTSTGKGNLVFHGRGGDDAPTTFHHGVQIFSGQVKSSGTGTITIVGTGGLSGPGGNTSGVVIENATGLLTSASGDISITGTGGSGNHQAANGLLVWIDGKITSTGGAKITINGTAGTGGTIFNDGVLVYGAASQISSTGGAIDITGTGGVNGFGYAMRFSTPVGILTSGGAAVTIIADSMLLDQGSINAAGSILSLRPKTAGTKINIGGADAAGTLGLSDAELDQVTASILRVGDIGGATSNITVTSAITQPAGWNTLSIFTAAGSISQTAPMTVDNLLAIAPNVNLTDSGNVVKAASLVSTSSLNFVSSTSLSLQSVDPGVEGAAFGFTGGAASDGPLNVTVLGVGNVLTVTGSVYSKFAAVPTFKGADIVLAADDMVINNTIDAGIGSVTLQQGSTTSRPIDVGLGTTAGSLGISAAELALITGTGGLVIGRADNTGNIAITAAIALTSSTTLEMRSGGSVGNTNALGADITIANLAIRAATGITLDTAVSNLAVRNETSGNIDISNTGAVTLGFVGSLDGSSGKTLGNFGAGTTTFKAASPFTYGVSFSSGGDITTTTAESAATHTDNITVSAGVTVESTGGNVRFLAADDVVISATATVKADVGDIILNAASLDTDGEGIMTIDGTISAGAIVTLSVNASNAFELPTVNSVTEGAGASILSNGLILTSQFSTRPFDLSASTTNAVGTLATIVTAAVTYTDSAALTLGPVGPNANTLKVFGIFTKGHDFTTKAGGQITVDGTVNVGNATITLNATTGGATETAGIFMTGTGLQLLGTGTFTLDSVNNDVALLSASINGALTYHDKTALEVTTVGTTTGITLTNSNLTLRAGGDIKLTELVDIGTGTAILATTGGGILDNNAGANNVTAKNLAMEATTGIGAADAIETKVSTITFGNTGGAVNIGNTGAVTVVGLKTIDASATATTSFNTGTTTNLSAASPITFAVNTTSAGTLTATAGETNDAFVFADKLTVNAGVTVESTGGDVVLQAGDNIVLDNTSVVQATTAGKTVTLTAGFGDLDASGAIVVIGANSIVATNLAMSALTGMGSLANPVVTTASNLEAKSATGGVFITNTGNVNIGGVSAAIDGVQATTSGDVRLVNTGSITLNGSAVEDIRANAGNVFVQAIGAAADVRTQNSSADAIDSNSGNVSIDAGRDILLGDAGVDNFGDIEANGNITLTAVRNITVDEDTFVDAFGVGSNITATAGGDISVIASDGTTGARMTTEGGTISVTTGTNGTFTVGAGERVASTQSGGAGDITITADNMVIDGTVDAGTECVVLLNVTNLRDFTLGGEVAGTVSLQDSELNFINAGVLQIGRIAAIAPFTGNINFAGAVNLTAGQVLAAVPTLHLVARGDITGAGAITVANLAVVSTNGQVNLPGTSAVTTLAGSASTSFEFNNGATPLTIGTVVVCSPNPNVVGITAGTDVIISADVLEITTDVVSGECVILQPTTAGWAITLGTEVAGTLSLTDAELNLIQVGDGLRIGNAAAGAVTLTASIDLVTGQKSAVAIPQLELATGSTVSQPAGVLTVDDLIVESVGAVTLNNDNVIDTVAALTTGAFSLTLAAGLNLNIGTLTNCFAATINGIATTNANVTLTADNMEFLDQVNAGTAAVILQNRTDGRNITLGSEVGGTLSFKDSELDWVNAGVLQIGRVTAAAPFTGNITGTAAIDLKGGQKSAVEVPTLHLVGAGSITSTNPFTVTNLALTSSSSVSFSGNNVVTKLAGSSDTTFDFKNAANTPLEIGTINVVTGSVVGITTNKLAANVTITADEMNITAKIEAGATAANDASVILVPNQDATAIVLGANPATAGTLELDDAELDLVTARVLQIGRATSGAISVNGTVSPGSIKTLHLLSAGNIGGAGPITVTNLALNSGDAVSLTGSNDVTILAGSSANAFSFKDATAITVDSITVVGTTVVTDLISTNSKDITLEAGGKITLNANVKTAVLSSGSVSTGGKLTFIAGAGLSQAGGIIEAQDLVFLGTGQFDATLVGNDVKTLAGATNGFIHYRDRNGLTTGNIVTTNNELSLLLLGDFTVPAGTTIDLGTSLAYVETGAALASKVNIHGDVIAKGVFEVVGGTGNNAFSVKPSSDTGTMILLWGQNPVPPAFPGDSLTTDPVDASIQIIPEPDINNARFRFTKAAVQNFGDIRYRSIESLAGLKLQASSVLETPTSFRLFLQATLNGSPVGQPISGKLPIQAPFLAAPQLVNPQGPFSAPSLAVGNVGGSPLPDLVIGSGSNDAPIVSVISGDRLFLGSPDAAPTDFIASDILTQFYAFDPTFRGGVYVAAADFDQPANGRAEIVAGAGAGGDPVVSVFRVTDAKTAKGALVVDTLTSFMAYGQTFRGGVRVAAGDINGDTKPDIITAAGPGGGPHVKAFNGHFLNPAQAEANKLASFMAYDTAFHGGVFVDVGDYNGDGRADILTGAGYGGGPHIKVFNGQSWNGGPDSPPQILNQFFDDLETPNTPSTFQDYQQALVAGVGSVGFGDINGDGALDIYIGSGSGRKAKVRIYLNGKQTPVLYKQTLGNFNDPTPEDLATNPPANFLYNPPKNPNDPVLKNIERVHDAVMVASSYANLT